MQLNVSIQNSMKDILDNIYVTKLNYIKYEDISVSVKIFVYSLSNSEANVMNVYHMLVLE